MLTASLFPIQPATALPCDPLPGFDDKCEAWVTGYDNTNGHGGYKTDYLNAIETSPDGNLIFATGTSWDDGTGSFDIMTLAFDTDGNVVWKRRHSSGPISSASSEGEMSEHATSPSSSPSSPMLMTPPSQQSSFRGDMAIALAVSPNGETVYVTGYSGFTDLNVGDLVTIAYDTSTGQERWVRTYDGPGRGRDTGWDIVVSPDGSRVFVTGRSAESSDSSYDVSSDFVTIGYDAASGEELWTSLYDGFEAHDYAYSIGVSPDGSRVFVTGPSTSAGLDYTTVSYDAESGDRIWVRRTDGGPLDSSYDLKASPDGSTVFVTGTSVTSPSSAEFLTEAYRASDGKRVWSVSYHGAHNGFAGANAIALDPAGATVYVTGYIPGERGYDYGTVAYDASTGQQQWTARYSWILTPSIAFAVVATSDRVVVTGYSSSFPLGAADATTVTYDPVTGQQLWAARYNPGTRGYGQALVVNPDASEVYVGGMFMTSGANTNYGLLAYSL